MIDKRIDHLAHEFDDGRIDEFAFEQRVFKILKEKGYNMTYRELHVVND